MTPLHRAATAREEHNAGSAVLDGVDFGNDVVFNQVLVRFADEDRSTDQVMTAVQHEGTCWMGGTTWRGRRCMRLSVSKVADHREGDIDRSTARPLDRSIARDAAT